MLNLLSLPIYIVLFITQSAILNRMPIMSGLPDILMLFTIGWTLHTPKSQAIGWAIVGGLIMDFASAIQLPVFTISYVIIASMSLLLSKQIEQYPIVLMLMISIAGTIIVHLITFISVATTGFILSLNEIINIVTIPSILLNLIYAIPIYGLAHELKLLLFPEETIL